MADFREVERDVPPAGDTPKNAELSTNQSLKTQFTTENGQVFTQPGLRPAFTLLREFLRAHEPTTTATGAALGHA